MKQERQKKVEKAQRARRFAPYPRVPYSINNFRTLIPAVRLRPLNLVSASSVNLHGLANTSIFHNNLRVILSPL